VEAGELPPGYFLITAKDIRGNNRLADFDIPVLGRDRLRYIGEPVGLLAGPDPDRLEELAPSCRVRAEELPGGAAPSAGNAAPTADNIEEIFVSRAVETGTGGGGERSGEAAPLHPSAFPLPPGGEGEMVIEASFRTGREEHWYAEPQGAIALPLDAGQGKGGGIVVYTASRWPGHVRRSLRRVLGLSHGMVKIESTGAGVHLDGKVWYPSLLACQAALAASVTGKPVKLVLTRDEDLRFSPKRASSEIRIASLIGKGGEIKASRNEIKVDMGGYNAFGKEMLDRAALGSLGPYRRGALSLEARALRTSLPPQGPLAGFGLAQGFFAAERHASMIADRLGEDPADWRRRNMLSGGERLAIGLPLKGSYPGGGGAAVLDAVSTASGYARKWAAYELLRRARREDHSKEEGEPFRGIGIALCYQGSGFLYPPSGKSDGAGDGGAAGALEATLEKDGSLEFKTGLAVSPGAAAAWAQTAGEVLGVDPSSVRVRAGDDNLHGGGPAALSRGIGRFTRLAEQCCLAIRKQRFRDPLPITVTRKCRQDAFSPWGDGEGVKADGASLARPAWAAAVAEVETDPASFTPRLRGLYMAVDGGRIVDPLKAGGAMRLGAFHAYSWASSLEPLYEGGLLSEAFLLDSSPPSPPSDFPITVVFLSNEGSSSQASPGSCPKGIGELPWGCVPAAYVQAVSQAVDYAFTSLPLTARQVWEAAGGREGAGEGEKGGGE